MAKAEEKKEQHEKQPSASSQSEMHPSQVKRKQTRYLGMVLLAAGAIGGVLYALFSSPAHHSTQKPEKEIRLEWASPATHVDDSKIWVERTQNALAQTQKTTENLQEQLQRLDLQKTVQEQAKDSQQAQIQILQAKLDALQAQLEQSALRSSKSVETKSEVISSASLSALPPLSPLRGTKDDILALSPQQKTIVKNDALSPSKTPDTFVPAGTFVRAVMLGGADASAGVTSQGNPTPVLFRLVDEGTLPNHHRSHLKDCVATAAAIGDISSERGQMRLERLSCVSPNQHEVIELLVEGTVFGPEGKNGVRGVPMWREGALLKRAFVAGTLSGFSQGIASQFTTNSISPSGAVNTVNGGDIFKFGAAQGVSNAMDKIADYNIRRADQYHPVIQLSAGTLVDIVFLKGFYLDGQKHDNESETILPPFPSFPSFEPILPVTTPPSPAVPQTQFFSVISENPSTSQKNQKIQETQKTQEKQENKKNDLPVQALPLSDAQVEALKAQNRNADFFKFTHT